MVLKNNEKQTESTKGDFSEAQESPAQSVETKNSEKENNNNEGQTDINAIKEQLSFEKDKLLRLAAEFENYTKRKQKEIDAIKKFANESILKELLSVADNLERAIFSAKENLDPNNLLEGIKLTSREMLKLFESFNVRPVKAENQSFDPNFHQAVTQEANDELPNNTVINVLQKGYLLHDRLIRPAMVVVSKRVENQETDKES